MLREIERRSEKQVCPYCHDGVSTEDAVLCTREGCGALYHSECWQDCVSQHGHCAVYGCDVRKATALGAVRVRLLRRRRAKRVAIASASGIAALAATFVALMLMIPREREAVPVVQGKASEERVSQKTEVPEKAVKHEPRALPVAGSPAFLEPVDCFALTPDGRGLAAAGREGVRLFGKALGVCPEGVIAPPGEGRVHAIAISPDGKMLATAADGYESLRLWYRATDRETRSVELTGYQGRVRSVSFLGNRFLVSASTDGTIRFWSVAGAGTQELAEYRLSPRAGVDATRAFYPLAAAAPDGKTIAFTDEEGVVTVTDLVPLAEGRARGPQKLLHTFACDGLAFSPDGSRLACVDGQTVFDIDLKGETAVHPAGLALPSSGAISIAFLGDGETLAWPRNSAAPGRIEMGRLDGSEAFFPDQEKRVWTMPDGRTLEIERRASR
ncbi:PD40 domain-containing protein [bacterium]|nr:PD40 domain-containing protein [bacterium]